MLSILLLFPNAFLNSNLLYHILLLKDKIGNWRGGGNSRCWLGHALEFVIYLTFSIPHLIVRKNPEIMIARFLFPSIKFNFNIATRGQHVPRAGRAERDLVPDFRQR